MQHVVRKDVTASRASNAPSLALPHRPPSSGYVRTPRDMQTFVPDHAASLT